MQKSQRQLVDAARPIRLSARTQKILLRSEMRLASAELALPSTLHRCVRRDRWSPTPHADLLQLSLRHYLSAEVQRIAPSQPLSVYRSVDENGALWRMSASLRALDAATQGAASRMQLERLCTMLAGQRGVLRIAGVRLVSGNEAVEIAMPPAPEAIARISGIGQWLAQPPHPSPIVHAAYLLLLVVNAHAFRDGNGRLSRVLFNHCLHRYGVDRRAYLPLYEASYLSAGAYEITLRRAELHWEWDEYIRYFCAVIELVTR